MGKNKTALCGLMLTVPLPDPEEASRGNCNNWWYIFSCRCNLCSGAV